MEQLLGAHADGAEFKDARLFLQTYTKAAKRMVKMMTMGMMAARTADVTGATIATSVFVYGVLEPGCPSATEDTEKIHECIQHWLHVYTVIIACQTTIFYAVTFPLKPSVH